MSTISDAVSLDRISRIVGYRLTAGDFRETSPNLPQRIGIVASANLANQETLDETPTTIISAQAAGKLYGFGSPIYSIARILFPITGTSVGVPVVVYPVIDTAEEFVPAEFKISISAASVTGSTRHYVTIGGRNSVDGQKYSVDVNTTDDADSIAIKVAAAINSVLGSPVSAVVNATNTNEVDLTVKFSGAVSNQVTVSVLTESAMGVTYAVTDTVVGVGVHDISSSLWKLGDEWSTILINGFNELMMSDFETVNGIPDPDSPTGRYQAIIFKPFFALTGNVSSEILDTIVPSITDVTARQDQVTNVLCPAPNSEGALYEAAANMAYLLASVTDSSPHLDVSGRSYPDMPVPTDSEIGDFAVYDNRNWAATHGCSTVTLKSDEYQVEDLVTTYHPDGEILPPYRFVRNLMIDFNFKYGYDIILDTHVRDKAIVASDQTVNVADTIKPKQFIQLLNSYADDLAERALIAEPSFMKANIQVQTGESNPDRLEATIKYKRSAYNRVTSTDAVAGFVFNLQ